MQVQLGGGPAPGAIVVVQNALGSCLVCLECLLSVMSHGVTVKAAFAIVNAGGCRVVDESDESGQDAPEQQCHFGLTAFSLLPERCDLRLLNHPLQRRRRRGACCAARYASA